MNVATYECNECEKSFKKKENLQSHLSAVHTVCLSQCEKCGKDFKNPEYLRNHVNRFHASEVAICAVCKKVCKSKANLYNHKRDVHERVENLLCNLCGEEQKNHSYLSRHKRRFCKFKLAKDPIVKLVTNPQNTLLIPENIVDANVSDVNDINDEVIEYTTGDSTTHIADVHVNADTLKENIESISKNFTESSKQTNIEDIDREVDWVFSDLETNNGFHLKEESKMTFTKLCENRQDACKKAFSPINLIESDNMETEIKEEVNVAELDKNKTPQSQSNSEFMCNQCNKLFKKGKYLNLHIKEVHKEVEMSSCEICSKQFKYFHLRKHMLNVHTREISACDECGKVYSNRKHLRDHKSVVHSGLDLLCDLCCKIFKGHSYLSNHVRRFHNSVDEEKVCDHCSKVFKSQNQLYLHNKAVHTIENLPCVECGKIYRNSYLLKKHIKHNHSKINN